MSVLARSRARTFAACALALLLAACAAPRVKPDAGLLARQSERERTLAAQPSWQLAGRLGVANAKDAGSGSLEWRQDGDAFRFSVHAPVTGKTWVLSGDAHRVVLEGLRAQPVEGDDAAALLERELGWHVPVAELSDWVRGARSKGEARIEFNGEGLPAVIEQDGWKIEYPDYDTTRQPPLPRKIFASRGDSRVRLSVSQWH
ncbi:MAG TPA: lipoprotein insertase outer membrane protein LolB [Rhodanobacteraceae bacterium]|nr:lipoprotein insertase outer membrane protein LolB [Rhodanobacteraceae bacterium]